MYTGKFLPNTPYLPPPYEITIHEVLEILLPWRRTWPLATEKRQKNYSTPPQLLPWPLCTTVVSLDLLAMGGQFRHFTTLYVVSVLPSCS